MSKEDTKELEWKEMTRHLGEGCVVFRRQFMQIVKGDNDTY